MDAMPISIPDGSAIGNRSLPARVPTARCGRHDLIVCDRDGIHRNDIEQLIRARFAEAHGASICSFMPTMFGMRNDSGRLCSVTGFRSAAQESLFLEQYLAEPIEAAIARVCGIPAQRSDIVEVGNLAGVNCRAAVRLVLQLPELLISRGHKWIVFTATGTVRQMLAVYRAPLIELAAAEPTRIRRSGDDWGRYYERDPRVMAGYLPNGISMRRGRDSSHV